MADTFDLLIIGGGINGAAVARDAAGRGLSVYLAEKGDYASGTSSASSKLVHGGIRYLEQYRFSLVRHSLKERETMMRLAPHLVFPLRFLLPITAAQSRPAWMVHLGLWFYDVLSGRRMLAKTGRLTDAERADLPRLRQDRIKAVMHYPDCWTDDARLTLETLLDARTRGADVGNYREVTDIRPDPLGFVATVAENGDERTVRARHIVNAAGPWAMAVLDRIAGEDVQRRPLSLVRGSHIVIAMPDPPQHDAYTLMNDDGRVVFVLPWFERFLIIGTTEVAQPNDLDHVACSDAERDYLIDCYNRFFDHPIGPGDMVWSYAGVRPLASEGSESLNKQTRESSLAVQRIGDGVLLTIYGGKLTTHRMLGEEVCAALGAAGVEMGGPWTATAPLHGGSVGRTALAGLAEEGPTIAPEVKRRWVYTYGSETLEIYDRIAADGGASEEVAPGVFEAELRHAADVEDARTAEDFLYRRTRLFLDLDDASRAKVEAWFAGRERQSHAAQ